ncbi:MAG: EutN/CcmL family microcompartment protein [Bacteroidetes bacterium]|nr:EutN/CcmL family microcompartment protein [Bacteroidota bacterium]
MIIGKVVGTVWATRKDPGLTGMKLLVIRQADLHYQLQDKFVIAVDSVGAGVGEMVLVASGSSARQTDITRNKPVDAVVMAIIDKLDAEWT